MLEWRFQPQTRLSVSGENLAEPNFNREDRAIDNIFLREFDQNVLDARCEDESRPDGKAPARIRIALLTAANGLDVNLLREIVAPLEPHLLGAGHDADQRSYASPTVLVVEEFGTLGLTGKINDTYATGDHERWANFWFGEGKRIKAGRSLGRKGQGKIVYHVVSGARTVLALTRRHDEERELLFGKCIVQRTHSVGDRHFTQHGYWSLLDSEQIDQPIPEQDMGKIARFKKGFSLERKFESGTSWVIPFVPAPFEARTLVKEFIRDFYFSVMRGALTADICGINVDETTVGSLLADAGITRPTPAYFAFTKEAITRPQDQLVTVSPGWEIGPVPEEHVLSSVDLNRLKEEIQEGKLISFRLPLQVFSKDRTAQSSFIDVHLQLRPSGELTEELYVRSGLCISEERHLADASRSAFGIVLADDEPIADFLGCCEEASHLKWNNTEKGAKERFSKIRETLSAVRQSMPRMFRLIAASSDKQVKDALIDILSIPTPGNRKRKITSTNGSGKNTPQKPKLKITRTNPEIFAMSDSGGRWKLRPGKDAARQTYPIHVTAEFAYDQLAGTGNPWREYHPYDFDLSDESLFKLVALKGVDIQTREENRLDFDVTSAEFSLELEGFSPRLPLLSRIKVDDRRTS